MSSLAPRFVRYVRSRGLIRPDDHVLVALSGGVDSMVLLHLLKSAAEELQIELRSAHFDHAMRADSAADADWVRQVCSAWNVQLTVARTDRPLQGETAARLARYQFLERAARETGSSRIATAHHADDQIETVLFRLMRGTGMRGLAGIPMRRGRFIRPLLRFHKSELLAYAATHDIAFREDPSNAQLDYARNRLRRIVLPALDAAHPEAAANVLSLARHAARTERAWREVLGHAKKDVIALREKGRIELARPVLLEYHPDLRVRLLRSILRGFATVPGRAESLQLATFVANAESGARTRFGAVTIERVFDRFRIERARTQVPHDSVLALGTEAGEGVVVIGGTRYQVRWQISPERTGDEVFDAGIAGAGLELRGWRPGDRIRLAYGTKKVKKLFAEKRVAVSDRSRIPVLSDSHGRVLWVVGVARSVDAPAGDAVPALNITVSNAEPS